MTFKQYINESSKEEYKIIQLMYKRQYPNGYDDNGFTIWAKCKELGVIIDNIHASDLHQAVYTAVICSSMNDGSIAQSYALRADYSDDDTVAKLAPYHQSEDVYVVSSKSPIYLQIDDVFMQFPNNQPKWNNKLVRVIPDGSSIKEQLKDATAQKFCDIISSFKFNKDLASREDAIFDRDFLDGL